MTPKVFQLCDLNKEIFCTFLSDFFCQDLNQLKLELNLEFIVQLPKKLFQRRQFLWFPVNRLIIAEDLKRRR